MALSVLVSDIEARWRTLSAAESLVAQNVIADALGILTTRRPLMDSEVIAGLVPADNVVAVVSAMVLRVLKNPDGKSGESIDDYRYTRDAAVATGALYVSDDELRLVTGVVIPRVRGVRLVAHGEL